MRWRASVDALEFEPGQFYRFTFNDSDGAFERSYTFAQYENDCPAGDFELLISETKGKSHAIIVRRGAGFKRDLKWPLWTVSVTGRRTKTLLSGH